MSLHRESHSTASSRQYSSLRRGGFVLLTTFFVLGALTCTSFRFASGGSSGPDETMLDTRNMVKMPSGSFLMGFSQGEPDEFPVHDISLSAFFIERTEVTNGYYRACVEAGVCRKSPYDDDATLGRPRHPVVGVSHSDATNYCDWIERRLPTEAEWEFAARYPSFSIFPWQGRFRPLLANARGGVDGYESTSPVAAFPDGKSGAGMMDMAGNAAEWTADWYDAVSYQKHDRENPTGPVVSTGKKVVRGGSWADGDYALRATARDAMEPHLGKNSVGFRCAKTYEAP